MKGKLIIIGASGHGKVVADCARKNGYEEIVFLDDNELLRNCGRYPVVGKSRMVKELCGDVVIAVGNARLRQKLQRSVDTERLAILIHPDAVVSEAEIGEGSVVMAGAVINPGSRIGRGCIINTSSSVDHDCFLGDFVHVSVGAHVAGNVDIGDRTWIGAGAVVSNNLRICSDCMIGAGAVVVKNLNVSGTYVGVPARRKSENENSNFSQQ